MSDVDSLLQPGRWLPEVRNALNQMIAAHGRLSPDFRKARQPLAVFDWDNTCAWGDIGFSVMCELDAHDQGGRFEKFNRLIETEGKPVAYSYAAFEMAGKTEEELRSLTRIVIEKCLADGTLRTRPEMQDLVATLQRHSWQVWVVSASSQAMVEVFAQRYGIGAERIIGVRLQKDDAGRLLPKLDGPLTFRAGKVEAIKKYIGIKPMFAAGDTDTDIEMLQAARFRLLIDGGNEEAQRAAADGGWWIQPANWE